MFSSSFPTFAIGQLNQTVSPILPIHTIEVLLSQANQPANGFRH